MSIPSDSESATHPRPEAERRSGSAGIAGWLALGLAAAGVRAIAWQRTAALFDDGPIFLALAQALLDGQAADVVQHPYHPLYPALIAIGGWIGLELETAAAWISILSGGATVVAFALWLDEAFDRRTAWVGGTILSLHPYAVSFSADVQSDGLYLALFAWSALFLWRAPQRGRASDWALAGGLSGLAYLARPEGLGLALLGGVALVGWVLAGRSGSARIRPAIHAKAAFAALAVAAAVPTGAYLVALHDETGSWRLTQKKSLSAMAGLEDAAPPSAASPLSAPAALPRAGDRPQPSGFPDRAASAAWELYRSSVSVFRFELLPFLAIGLFAARGRPGWRGAFAGGIGLAYGVLLAALVATAGYVSRRHALPPLLPLLGYAASGMAVTASAILARWPGSAGAVGSASDWRPVALVAAVLVLAWGPRDVAPRRLDRLAERRAAEWVREHRSDPGPIAAGRPRVAYYADRPYVPLPSGPPGGMLHYLRSHGVRYVIVDESKLDAHEGLRDAEARGLRRIRRESHGGRTAAVFEVESESDSAP